MSAFRAPIRCLLASAPTRATKPTIPFQYPVVSRTLNRRSYATSPTTPTDVPTTPTSSPILSPASSASTSDPRSPPPSPTTATSHAALSHPLTSRPPVLDRPTQSRLNQPPPGFTLRPVSPTAPVPRLTGYRGPEHEPTKIKSYLPPYTPPPPPDLPYHVQRSKTNHLPVYTLTKAHGTRKETRIRHVRGDAKALAEGLSELLSLPLGRTTGVWVNHQNGQVVVKGHYAQEIMNYLDNKGF